MPTRLTLLLRVFPPFAFGYFLSYLYRTVNAVIAPDLMRDLTLNPAGLGLLTSAYFLAFAAFQLPLGLLLDRFGARRVEAILLLFAAAGALVFSLAQTLPILLLGRALIGLGVSACLMAAFKAFTTWLPANKLPLANGVQMVSGGIGALAATAPVEMALHFTDWRGLFMILSALTLAAAVIIYLAVPEHIQTERKESLSQQLAGLRNVFASRDFWTIAPWAFTSQAAYLSILGLWSGPWLSDVAGLDRMQLANVLLGISIAMICGYFLFGALAERLSRIGIPPSTVCASGMSGFMLIQLLLVFQLKSLYLPLWLGFGLFGTCCILPYAMLSQSFPPHLSGRANTCLNLLVFTSAFAAQWVIGAIVGQWPVTVGQYAPIGYSIGFALLLFLETTAAIWYFVARRKPN